MMPVEPGVLDANILVYAFDLRALSDLLAYPGIHVLPSPAHVARGWMELPERRPVTGGAVFDLDFEPFTHLAVLTPFG